MGGLSARAKDATVAERHEPEEAPRDHAGAPHVLGELLRRGEPEPSQIADLVEQHPEDEDAIMLAVQELFGNGFAGRVEAGTKKNKNKNKKKKKQKPVPASAEVREAVQNLVDQRPTDPAGYATFLVTALDLGFFKAGGDSDDQLRQLQRFDPDDPATKVIHSEEGYVSEKNYHDYPEVERLGRKTYNVTIDGEPEILETIASVLWQRLTEWLEDHEAPEKVLLEIGSLVRADPQSTGRRYHAKGQAADFGMSMGSATEHLELLADLPPGQIADVVPDNDGHTHVARTGDEYHLGLPFQGPFFEPDLELPRAKAKAIANATDTSKPLPVVGLVEGATRSVKVTASYEDGAWQWGKEKTGKPARSFLGKKIKKALSDFEKRGGKQAFVDDDGVADTNVDTE